MTPEEKIKIVSRISSELNRLSMRMQAVAADAMKLFSSLSGGMISMSDEQKEAIINKYSAIKSEMAELYKELP